MTNTNAALLLLHRRGKWHVNAFGVAQIIVIAKMER